MLLLRLLVLVSVGLAFRLAPHIALTQTSALSAQAPNTQEDGFALDAESRQQMQALWDLLDKDKNGVLELADWPSTAVAVAQWETVRQHLDLDGDKKVTREEFVDGFKKMAISMPLDADVFPSVPGSHGEWFQKLQQSFNKTVKKLLKDLHEGATVAGVVPPTAKRSKTSEVGTAALPEEGTGQMFGRAQGSAQFPTFDRTTGQSSAQGTFGGVNAQGRPADAEVAELCKTVMYQIRETYRKNHAGNDFENATFEESLTPISYKTQVVAGTNFFVKAQLANEKFSDTYLLLKIYKHFSMPAVLTAMKESEVTADTDEEF